MIYKNSDILWKNLHDIVRTISKELLLKLHLGVMNFVENCIRDILKDNK